MEGKMDGRKKGSNVRKLRVQHQQATGLRPAVVAAPRNKAERNLPFLNDNRSLEQPNNATRLFVLYLSTETSRPMGENPFEY